MLNAKCYEGVHAKCRLVNEEKYHHTVPKEEHNSMSTSLSNTMRHIAIRLEKMTKGPSRRNGAVCTLVTSIRPYKERRIPSDQKQPENQEAS
jgi:hypothetical protein